MRDLGRVRARALALFASVAVVAAAAPARAEDFSGIVARARDQVESGAYAEAEKTLAELPPSGVPPALAVEAALLETTAVLVTRGTEAGEAACARAVASSGYDPEVARDLSPKVRSACRAAAKAAREKRVERDGITFTGLAVETPEVAWQPVRIHVEASAVPAWLRVVARVTSSALDGSFDLALAPSVEGPLRGTLDSSWIRPKAKVRIELVAQDRHGDLGGALQSVSIEVPSAESLVALGEVPKSATVSVDGKEVAVSADGRAPVSPGTHVVAMVLADGAASSTTVEIERGHVARVGLSPTKAAPGRTLAWIATGTAVALGAVGSVLLVNADARRSEIEDLSARREEGTDLPATDYGDLVTKDEERETFATLGAGFLIAGGVAGLAAVALWVWPEVAPKKRAVGAAVVPTLGPGSIGVSGRF